MIAAIKVIVRPTQETTRTNLLLSFSGGIAKPSSSSPGESLPTFKISATASRSPVAANSATASEHRRLVVGYTLLRRLEPLLSLSTRKCKGKKFQYQKKTYFKGISKRCNEYINGMKKFFHWMATLAFLFYLQIY